MARFGDREARFGEREADFLSRERPPDRERDLRPERERDLRPRDREREDLRPRDLDRDLRPDRERDLPLRERERLLKIIKLQANLIKGSKQVSKKRHEITPMLRLYSKPPSAYRRNSPFFIKGHGDDSSR